MGLFEGARARRAAMKEAERFAASVQPGDVISVTNTHNTVTGTQDLVMEYTVGSNGRVGSDTVAGLFLRNKAVTRHRPAGLMTVAEYTDMQVAGPDPAKAVDQPKRAKAGARR